MTTTTRLLAVSTLAFSALIHVTSASSRLRPRAAPAGPRTLSLLRSRWTAAGELSAATAASGGPGGHRTREGALPVDLRGLPRDRFAGRTAGWAESPAIANRPQRQERRADRDPSFRVAGRIRLPARRRCRRFLSRPTTSRRWSNICTACSARPARRDGRRKASSSAPEKILVGRRRRRADLLRRSLCASCHSVTGDLKGIASRVPDPRALQDLWVSGGGGRGRGGRGRGADGRRIRRRPVTVTSRRVRRAVAGTPRLRIDDFVGLADSRRRHSANFRAERRRTQGRRPRSGRRAPEARARAGRQGHAQRDGISLDAQVMTRTIALLLVADLHRARRAQAPGARSRDAPASRSPTRGRPIPATTPANATARSRRSIRRR